MIPTPTLDERIRPADSDAEVVSRLLGKLMEKATDIFTNLSNSETARQRAELEHERIEADKDRAQAEKDRPVRLLAIGATAAVGSVALFGIIELVALGHGAFIKDMTQMVVAIVTAAGGAYFYGKTKHE